MNFKEASYGSTNKKFLALNACMFKALIWRRFYKTLSSVVSAVLFCTLIAVGVVLIMKGHLTIASFVIIYAYMGNVKGMCNEIGFVKQYASECSISSSRIFDLMTNFEKETFGTIDHVKEQSALEFKDVEFGYNEDSKVLKGVSICFEPNTTTALVGKSGAGKSTIVSLSNKLYNISAGEILLGGENINNLTENCLRDYVSIVTQSPYIFSKTIKENLLLVKEDATDEELADVLKQTQIYDFVCTLSNGIDTKLGENGITLSGGQKQRFAIARALLKASPIIILDEATSALDNENQSKIVDVLSKLKKDHTIIVVAHRLSTIVDADKIVVLSDGKVLQEGTHKQLLSSCEVYKELYATEEKAGMINC